MIPHKCKKPFLCSCEVDELAEKTSDRMMEIVKEHFKTKEQMTAKEINIQDEVQKIHSKYGTSEMANYKIQLLFEKYANQKVLHIAEQAVDGVKKKNIEADFHDVGWNGACNVILSRIKQITEQK